MTRILPRALRASLTRFLGEGGTASVEFVMAVPVILTIFMASFETGFFMLRSVMLEQALDMTMREVRLGHVANIDKDVLKAEVCSRILMFTNCETDMMIEMVRVNTDTWALPADVTTCVDRDDPGNASVDFEIGQQNDMMMVRACIIQDALFPSTGLALEMPIDPGGGYSLYAKSAYVVEPTS